MLTITESTCSWRACVSVRLTACDLCRWVLADRLSVRLQVHRYIRGAEVRGE